MSNNHIVENRQNDGKLANYKLTLQFNVCRISFFLKIFLVNFGRRV